MAFVVRQEYLMPTECNSSFSPLPAWFKIGIKTTFSFISSIFVIMWQASVNLKKTCEGLVEQPNCT